MVGSDVNSFAKQPPQHVGAHTYDALRAIATTVLSSDEGVEIKDIRASTKPTEQQVWWWRTNAPKHTNVDGYYDGVVIGSRTVGRDALPKDCKSKAAKTLELIGCTPDELLEHLERTMSPEVRTLRDEGVKIVVDHIIPCAAFDFSIPEHQRICFHYTNLQYLDAPTNGSKSDKLPDGFDFASWFEAARARVL
ncbi:SBP-type domain-containing protein [Pycnococcus provasolii]